MKKHGRAHKLAGRLPTREAIRAKCADGFQFTLTHFVQSVWGERKSAETAMDLPAMRGAFQFRRMPALLPRKADCGASRKSAGKLSRHRLRSHRMYRTPASACNRTAILDAPHVFRAAPCPFLDSVVQPWGGSAKDRACRPLWHCRLCLSPIIVGLVGHALPLHSGSIGAGTKGDIRRACIVQRPINVRDRHIH